MSMIDYDARPVTPQVLLVGHRASSVGYNIRDFLSRNGVPYEWVDVDDAARVAALLPPEERGVDQLPVCVLPNGIRLCSGHTGRCGGRAGDGVGSVAVGVRPNDRGSRSSRAGSRRVRRF